MILLAYDGLLNKPLMREICPNSVCVGKYLLSGYVLEFKGGRHDALLTVTETGDETDIVETLMYRITPAHVQRLNSVEAVPEKYRANVIAIQQGKDTVEALVYVANDFFEYGAPSVGYLNILLEAYKQNEFDVEALKRSLDMSVRSAEESDSRRSMPASEEFIDKLAALFNVPT